MVMATTAVRPSGDRDEDSVDVKDRVGVGSINQVGGTCRVSRKLSSLGGDSVVWSFESVITLQTRFPISNCMISSCHQGVWVWSLGATEWQRSVRVRSEKALGYCEDGLV